MPHKPLRPDLKYGWEVRMHCDLPHYDQLRPNPKNHQEIECPGCKAFKARFLVIDVSQIPHCVSGGLKWACDGCWNKWIAQGKKLPDGRVFDEARLIELMGAPQALIDEVEYACHKKRGNLAKPHR